MPLSYASTCSDSGSQDLSTWGQSEGAKRPSVGGGGGWVWGGGVSLPNGREIFAIFLYPNGLFWHIKRLIIRPPLFPFLFSLSPINRGWGQGSCTPLSYASDSGVTT